MVSIWKPLALPVWVDRSTSRAPLKSCTIEADTPALAALMRSRTAARLSAPAPTLIVTGRRVGSATNDPLAQLPRPIVMSP